MAAVLGAGTAAAVPSTTDSAASAADGASLTTADPTASVATSASAQAGANVTEFYGSDIVEGHRGIQEVAHAPDGGALALEVYGSSEEMKTDIVRLDAAGSETNRETISGYLDTITRVDETGYVAVGFRDDDVLAVGLDADGTVRWTDTFGGDQPDWGLDVVSAPGGDAYLLSSSESVAQDSSDLWVVRVDETGGVVWERTVEHETWTAFPKGERLKDGSLVATIRTKRSMDKSVDGKQNVSVVRMLPDGSVEWRTVVAGTSEPIDKEEMFDVIPAHGDGVLIVGASNSGNEDESNFDYWAAQVDSAGELLWQRQYDGPMRGFVSGAVRTAEGYLLAGFVEQDDGGPTGAILEIDAAGEPQSRAGHEEVPEFDDRFLGLDWTTDGRLLVGGGTTNVEDEQRHSRAWIVDMTEAVDVEPGPTAWESQHGQVEASEVPTSSASIPDSSMDLVLYGATGLSMLLLVVPHGRRRLRRWSR